MILKARRKHTKHVAHSMIFVTSLIILLIFLSGCTLSNQTQQDSSIQTITSLDEITSYLQQTSHSQTTGNPVGLSRVESSTQPSVAMDSASPASLDTSQTNVQVEGIDEIDMFKIQDEYIYTISGQTLFIIEAYPAQDAHIILNKSFDFYPTGLFLHGNTLLVVGQQYESFQTMSSFDSGFARILPHIHSTQTVIELYDISQKNSPQLQDSYLVEGSFVEARLQDKTAYILTQTQPHFQHPFPIILRGGVDISQSVLDVSRIAYNSHAQNPQSLSIHSFDLQQLEYELSLYYLDPIQTIYMSENAFYLVSTEYINEYELERELFLQKTQSILASEQRDLIRRIQQTDSDILSQIEKDQKIYVVHQQAFALLSKREQELLYDDIMRNLKEELASYESLVFSHIQKITVDGLQTQSVGRATILGRVHNQFALDEHDEVLRVATTVPQRWSRFTDDTIDSYSLVYTFDETLQKLDSVTQIAPTQSIYATRFVGDMLYMVTFQEIDPFFVIDLSEPTHIQILGELKIPGFSRYLHPFDENIIIGVGQDITDLGRVNGLKISLFDVSDVTNPIELTSYVTKDSQVYSQSLFEHKAFFLDVNRNTLIIPLQHSDWREPRQSYAGAFVFDIDSNDVSLRGFISHSQGREQIWNYQVERIGYIEEIVYTKSQNLLRMHDFESLKSVNDISLVQEEQLDFVRVY